MIKSVNRRDICREIAKTNGVSLRDVNLVVESQFSLVRKIMKEGNFEAVRLPFFGRFRVRPGRKRYIDERKKRREERDIR